MYIPPQRPENKMNLFEIDKIAHFAVSGMIYLLMFAILHNALYAFSIVFIVGFVKEMRDWKYDSAADMICNVAGALSSMGLIGWIVR